MTSAITHPDMSETIARQFPLRMYMSHISFALYEAHQAGASLTCISETLGLPLTFVCERIEAARLCLLVH